MEDDPLGPLGAPTPSSDSDNNGLGGATARGVQPPVPPLKEQLPLRTTLPPSTTNRGGRGRGSGPPDPHHIDDDDDDAALFGSAGRGRPPPPVPASLPSPVKSSTAPSMSVEQAARPTFHITVGDPHKVGDLATSHIVYSVRTKVSGIPKPDQLGRTSAE